MHDWIPILQTTRKRERDELAGSKPQDNIVSNNRHVSTGLYFLPPQEMERVNLMVINRGVMDRYRVEQSSRAGRAINTDQRDSQQPSGYRDGQRLLPALPLNQSHFSVYQPSLSRMGWESPALTGLSQAGCAEEPRQGRPANRYLRASPVCSTWNETSLGIDLREDITTSVPTTLQLSQSKWVPLRSPSHPDFTSNVIESSSAMEPRFVMTDKWKSYVSSYILPPPKVTKAGSQ